jgi:hypothetical protein
MSSSGMWYFVDLHGATSQKTTLFIVTAVKASNLTIVNIFLYKGF